MTMGGVQGLATAAGIGAPGTSAEMRLVLDRLARQFGPRFHVVSTDGEWVNVKLDRTPDQVLFELMDGCKQWVFGADIARFAIRCAVAPGQYDGVSILFLGNGKWQEFLPDFLYY